jgi:hypothetical protein
MYNIFFYFNNVDQFKKRKVLTSTDLNISEPMQNQAGKAGRLDQMQPV